MVKTIGILLSLYVVSLTASNAGMEIFSNLLALSFLGFFLWDRYRNKNAVSPYRKLGPDFFLWSFWVVGIIGAIALPALTPAERIEIVGEFRWILFFYSIYAIMHIMEEQGHLDKFLKLLFVFGGIVGTYSCFQFFFGWDPFRDPPVMHPVHSTEWWRAKGFFRNTMTYSYSFGMLFCFMAAYHLVRSNKEKWENWALSVIVMITGLSLVMTFTRGLWLSLGAAVLVMAFKYSKRVFASALVTILIGVTFTYNTFPAFQKRVDSIRSFKVGSNYQRIDLWAANWEMFKDHPLIGVGYGRNTDVVAEYNMRLMGKRGFIGHAHNHFFQVLAGTGILGFISFLCIFGFFLWQALQAWAGGSYSNLTKALALGSIGAQTVFHIGGLTESVLIDNECLHMFIFLHSAFLAKKVSDEGAQTVSA